MFLRLRNTSMEREKVEVGRYFLHWRHRQDRLHYRRTFFGGSANAFASTQTLEKLDVRISKWQTILRDARQSQRQLLAAPEVPQQ